METIGGLIFIGILGLLFLYGKKLMSYKSTVDQSEEKDLMQELRSINSIIIDVVPAKEIYGYLFGGCIWFFVYYCAIGILSSHPAGLPLLGGVVAGMFVFPFVIAFYLSYFWYYAYFRKAIAPNMKYGKILLSKIHKLIFVLGVLFGLIVIFVSSIKYHSDGYYHGQPFLGFVIGTVVCLILWNAALGFEMQRLGVPNLLEGIKKAVRAQN